MTIYEEFVLWITSMIEDSPIPHEIKFLYFVLDFSNNYSLLSFAGCERREDPLLNYEYFPLDAYNFANKAFLMIKDIFLAKITVKELIEKALETSLFKNIFKNKQMFICEKFKKIEYIFKV